MAYRDTWKRRKVWSQNAVAAKERKRLEGAEPREHVEIDPYIKIEITRRGTGEHVVFECFEGSRVDNYSVHCNGRYLGMQSITTLTTGIRKALPAYRRQK